MPAGAFADQARTAFAVGWAATNASLTDRTRIAVNAAVGLAVEHAGQPGVLEATMQLGSLEGVWAELYARRETLYAKHDTAIMAAWQALVEDQFDAAGVVATFRRSVGEAASDSDQRRREREAAAIAAALAALHRLLAATSDTRYRALLESIEHGLRDGVAEGTAGAIAIAAQQLGHTSIRFDRAFADAKAALTDVEQYQAQAAAWAKQTGEAAARALGRRLAADADTGAADQDMVDTAQDTSRTGWLGTAVAAFTDWAIGHAFTLGATAVYATLSVASVNWITVGDSRVCPRCQSLEDGNPYPLFGAPSPPAHPRCRCTTEPAGAVASLGRFVDYLTGG